MRRIIVTILVGTAVGLFSAVGSALAQDGSEIDPLLEVAADMNAAALKLGKLHTDAPTQTAQKSALKKLDEIIARLEEEEKGQSSAFGNRPATQSTIRKGPGGMGTLHADRREGKQWGELPPKERERILQSMNDGFPSHYQRILERYFARLADEKPLDDTESSGADAAAGGPAAATTEPDKTAPAPGKATLADKPTPADKAAPAAPDTKDAK
jgi:hypothetical protein